MSAAISIAGVTPVREHAPADRAQLAAIVRDLAAARQTFAFVGGGTDLDFGNPPRALDAVVRTTALKNVIAYAPEDQLITVEGGMRIADLDALLRDAGQFVPIDVADRTYATVGGAIATNAYGPRRHRYGSIKDLIVGVEIVRPDGTFARGGGNVVKNVAGFDVPKLMVGSLGTLGAIVSATLRVFPIPRVTRAIALETTLGGTLYAAALADRALDPAEVVFEPERGIVLTFAGEAAAVDAQLERTAATAASHGIAAAVLGADTLERHNARVRDVRGRGPWRATIAQAPRAAAIAPACLPPSAASVTFPTLGVVVASSESAFDPAAVARARTSGNVVFHAMPGRARAGLDAWGPPPPAFALMRALKQRFDPLGLCNPGRFVGGL